MPGIIFSCAFGIAAAVEDGSRIADAIALELKAAVGAAATAGTGAENE